MNIWSLYKYEAEPAEGTAYAELVGRYPKRANHDGFNELFIGTSELETNYVTIDSIEAQLPDDIQGKERLDKVAWMVAQVMANPDRPVIYGTPNQWVQLHKHPAYRLYCNGYEDEAKFRSDIDYVTGMIPDSMVDAKAQWIALTENMTHGQSQDIMVNLIRSFGA